MQTIAENAGPSGEGSESAPKVPRVPLQAKIDEPLFDRVSMLAAKRRCDKRVIVTEALEGYLPGAELEAGLAK